MFVILFGFIAGTAGTGLGALTSALLYKRASERLTCWMLSFAAGVMLSVVCFGLVPETLALTDITVVITSLVAGILAAIGLNRAVDKITETRAEKLLVHQTHAELYHEEHIIKEKNVKMLRSGVLMMLAIALHNIPEGMAIGAGGSHDVGLGIMLGVVIALHNIPEGMAVATPMLAGGINRWKVLSLTMLSETPSLIGGIIGLLLGSISQTAVAVSMGIAGGAMLYIVFGEIIPQSIVMTKNRTASVVTLFGVIVGIIIARM